MLCYLTDLGAVQTSVVGNPHAPFQATLHDTTPSAWTCRSAISTQVHQQQRHVSGVLLTFLFVTSRSHFAPRFRAWPCHFELFDPSARRPLHCESPWTDINSKILLSSPLPPWPSLSLALRYQRQPTALSSSQHFSPLLHETRQAKFVHLKLDNSANSAWTSPFV